MRNIIPNMLIASSTLLFLSLVLTTTATSPPMIQSRCFKLKSHVLSPLKSIFDCHYLEQYHIYPTFDYAALVPDSAERPAIIGYLNGTAGEMDNEEAELLFKDESGLPYGFVIDQVNATYNPIEIKAGNGTKGIFIDQGIIKFHNPISGGFYGTYFVPPNASSTLARKRTMLILISP